MLECIHRKTYGGKWYSFLCPHLWKQDVDINNYPFKVEKCHCIECGKTEILLLVDWNICLGNGRYIER